MRYVEFPPSPALRAVVECYWLLEGEGSGVPEPIIPDGRVELILHYGVRFERHHPDGAVEQQDAAILVGQMLAPACIAHRGMARVAAIRLRPSAVRAVVGCSAHDITGRFVDLDAVLGNTAALRERLALAGSDAACVRLLEAWLRARVRRAPSAEIAATVDVIGARGGAVDLARLAAGAGLSLRQLERRFVNDVGLTPKSFARLARLQSALRRISAGEPLADVAHACGYYDQPHMARDFSLLAEMSPAAWRQFGGTLAPLFVTR